MENHKVRSSVGLWKEEILEKPFSRYPPPRQCKSNLCSRNPYKFRYFVLKMKRKKCGVRGWLRKRYKGEKVTVKEIMSYFRKTKITILPYFYRLNKIVQCALEGEVYYVHWNGANVITIIYLCSASFISQSGKQIRWNDFLACPAFRPLFSRLTFAMARARKRISSVTQRSFYNALPSAKWQGTRFHGFWVALRCLVNSTSEASSTNLFSCPASFGVP